RDNQHGDDQHQPDHADDRAAEAAPDQREITLVTGTVPAHDHRLVGGRLVRRRRHRPFEVRRQRYRGVDQVWAAHAVALPRRIRGSSSASRISEMMLPTIRVAASTSMKVAVTQTSPTASEPTIAGPTVGSPNTMATSISPV